MNWVQELQGALPPVCSPRGTQWAYPFPYHQLSPHLSMRVQEFRQHVAMNALAVSHTALPQVCSPRGTQWAHLRPNHQLSLPLSVTVLDFRQRIAMNLVAVQQGAHPLACRLGGTQWARLHPRHQSKLPLTVGKGLNPMLQPQRTFRTCIHVTPPVQVSTGRTTSDMAWRRSLSPHQVSADLRENRSQSDELSPINAVYALRFFTFSCHHSSFSSTHYVVMHNKVPHIHSASPFDFIYSGRGRPDTLSSFATRKEWSVRSCFVGSSNIHIRTHESQWSRGYRYIDIDNLIEDLPASIATAFCSLHQN